MDRLLQRRDKGRHSLGEVVHGNGERGEHAHPHQLVLGRACGLRVGRAWLAPRRLDFVRVLIAGDELVDQRDEQHTPEKRADGRPRPGLQSQRAGQRLLRFGKNLHHGNIDHDAGGETETKGKKFIVCPLGEQRKRTAAARCQPCEQGKKKRVKNLIHAGKSPIGPVWAILFSCFCRFSPEKAPPRLSAAAPRIGYRKTVPAPPSAPPPHARRTRR